MSTLASTIVRPTTSSLVSRLRDAAPIVAAYAEEIGKQAARYGLVLIVAWIGAMKFTTLEAQAIRPFVENSPFFSWTYPAFGVQGMANILGVTELTVAALIASRYWSPAASAVGSLLAVGMFTGTLSFLVTTPGAWADELGGFPAIAVIGQFLIKDAALLAIAIWSFGESLRASLSNDTQ